MDCRTTKENMELYIDGFLDAEKQQLFEMHISGCKECQRELEALAVLKRALADMGGLEPPIGLAKSAIKKARKRRLPSYAYISVAAAAVLAFIVILSTGIMINQNADMAASKEKMAASGSLAQDEDGAIEAETFAMDMAPAAEAAPAEDMADAPSEAVMAAAPEEAAVARSDEALQSDVMLAESVVEPYVVTVIAGNDGIRKGLDQLIEKYKIAVSVISENETTRVSFIVPEPALADFQELTLDLQYTGELIANGYAEFIFEN